MLATYCFYLSEEPVEAKIKKVLEFLELDEDCQAQTKQSMKSAMAYARYL